MKAGTLRNIRLGLVFFTIIGGFLFWLFLPETVVIHDPGGRLGNKVFLLVGFFMPLFSFIPWKWKFELPEVHVDCEESRQMVEKAKSNGQIYQLLIAGVMCVLVWISLLSAAY